MFDRQRRSLSVTLLFAVLLAVASVAYATRSSPTDTATATSETLSPVQAQDGWCQDVTTATVDAWASAPVRITAANKAAVRFVQVCHADDTDATIDLCASLGTSSGLTCASDSGTRGKMSNVGECFLYPIARDSAGAAPPSLNVKAASGTVTACFDVFY